MTLAREYGRLSRHPHQIAGLVRGKGRSTAQLMAELRGDPAVESVEPNYLRHVSALGSTDPDFPKLWGLHNSGQTVNVAAGTSGVDTKFVGAWNLARPDAGEEIVVAVVDTGVDIGHPDLIANLWTNPGEIPGNGIDDDRNGKVDDMHGYDFVAGAVAFAAMNFPADTLAERIDRILANVTPVAALAGKVATGGTLNLQGMIDTDGDRLPDWWEGDHFGSLATASAADPDGDGFTNVAEFLAGTSPSDPASKLAFSSVHSGAGSAAADIILTFPTVADHHYQVEWSADLGDWAPLGSRITGNGSPVAVRDTEALMAATRRFYRLRLIAP